MMKKCKTIETILLISSVLLATSSVSGQHVPPSPMAPITNPGPFPPGARWVPNSYIVAVKSGSSMAGTAAMRIHEQRISFNLSQAPGFHELPVLPGYVGLFTFPQITSIRMDKAFVDHVSLDIVFGENPRQHSLVHQAGMRRTYSQTSEDGVADSQHTSKDYTSRYQSRLWTEESLRKLKSFTRSVFSKFALSRRAGPTFNIAFGPIDLYNLFMITQTNTSWPSQYAYVEGAGAHVDVYILDGGIDAEHPEIAGDIKTLQPNTFLPYFPSKNATWRDDGFGQGTGVAAVIRGRNLGISPSVGLVNGKILGPDGAVLSLVLSALNDAVVEHRMQRTMAISQSGSQWR